MVGRIYSVRCPAAAAPRDRVHVLARLVPPSRGPGHQEEQLKAASTQPVQKYPAASVSLFLLFCLKRGITIPMINTLNVQYVDLFVYEGSVDLVVFCSPPPPHVHLDVLEPLHRELGTECSFHSPLKKQYVLDRIQQFC